MEEDFEKELLADFGSDASDMELASPEEHPQAADTTHAAMADGKADIYNDSEPNDDPEAQLRHLIANANRVSFQKALDTFDILTIYDISQDSKILPLIPYLRQRMSNYQDTDIDILESISGNKASNEPEYQFILMVNEISLIINQEIEFVHSFNRLHYKLVFPELETIVGNPTDYATLVLLLGQDLTSANNAKVQEDLKTVVSNEKVLVITMSAAHQVQKQLQAEPFRLNEADFALLSKGCSLILDLNAILKELSFFMANKLYKFAPNVNAIVGPITTSQFLTAAGSLRQLSTTPSCNLASLGIKDLSSQKLGAKSRTVRQTGYLYHNELVKYLPEEIQKPAMRIISGKIILAARIDLSKSKPDGSLGKAFRAEIESKIEKLLAPPKNQGEKALPIPIDEKSKKRGGKRFRKARERMQMSDLRRAQNKMAFGEQEDTVMDSFGEEIGLGMSRGGTGSLSIKLNKNTSANMSKGMASRLQNATNNQGQVYDLESLVFSANGGALAASGASTIQRPQTRAAEPSQQMGKVSTTQSTWFSGMKRKRTD